MKKSEAEEISVRLVNTADNIPGKTRNTEEMEITAHKNNTEEKGPGKNLNKLESETDIPTEKKKVAQNKLVHNELEFEKEIEIKVSSDMADCKVYACALISPSQIALADAGNKSVKVVDVIYGDLVSAYKLESEPFHVAIVRVNLIAVTLPDKNEIMFLNISQGGKITPSHELKVNSKCKGVASDNESLFILYQDHVEILNIQGQQINQISHSVWDNLMEIALSHDSKTFYVTDSPLFGNARVYKFDYEGNLIATYVDKDLNDVRGLCVTKDDTVYVCNYEDKGSIHTISPNCKKIQEILKDNKHVRYPWCVAFCYKTEKLFVCNNELELSPDLRNKLKIFQWKCMG